MRIFSGVAGGTITLLSLALPWRVWGHGDVILGWYYFWEVFVPNDVALMAVLLALIVSGGVLSILTRYGLVPSLLGWILYTLFVSSQLWAGPLVSPGQPMWWMTDAVGFFVLPEGVFFSSLGLRWNVPLLNCLRGFAKF